MDRHSQNARKINIKPEARLMIFIYWYFNYLYYFIRLCLIGIIHFKYFKIKYLFNNISIRSIYIKKRLKFKNTFLDI